MSKTPNSPVNHAQMLHQTIDLQQRGNLKAAERRYRSILKASPKHSDALQFLAILLQQKGNAQSANHFMQKALKILPDNPVLLSNQAEIYRLQGNWNQAEKFAHMALTINAKLLDPLVILGSVHQIRKQYSQASEYFTKALEINPGEHDVRNELGNTLSTLGQFREAVEHYQTALLQQPEFDACRINLADSLISLDDTEQAIQHYKTVLTHQPRLSAVYIKLGKAFETLGQTSESISCFRTVLEMDRNNTEALYWSGIHSQTMGLFDQASDYFLKVIERQPDNFDAWHRLSLNQDFSPSESQFRQLETQYRATLSNDPDDPVIPTLGFTLGKFSERRGDYSTSFDYFQSANRVKALRLPFDKVQHDAQVDNIIKVFNPDFFKNRSHWGNPSVTPIFIIGMPRSGTTLVEQIISSHPDVFGAGERQSMLNLVGSLTHQKQPASTSHAQLVSDLSQSEVSSIAADYLKDLQKLSPDATAITDKMPGNYFRLGVIFLLFPNARVIHCRRDPMDTCWSCYQQNFEQGLHFTNDLGNLAHAYRAYRRLMSHWHDIKPGHILDIEYESLLTNPPIQSQRLLEYCDLNWDPVVLNFHQQQRPVATASVWQVRQPLYQSSVNRWKAYESQLLPLHRLLGLTE